MALAAGAFANAEAMDRVFYFTPVRERESYSSRRDDKKRRYVEFTT